LLIVAGTIVLQYHSIRFWSEHVDPVIGWLWSIVIEGAGLWMWYRRDLAGRVLGLVASVLLLAGPLYQIAVPVIQKNAFAVAENTAREQRVSILRAQIAHDAQLLLTFTSNSTKRTGWLEAIERTDARLAHARAELARLLAKKPESVAAQSFAVWWVVLLEALALVLVQISNVLAINHLSMMRASMRTDAQAPAKAGCEEQAEELLPYLREQVRALIEHEALTIAQAAERLGVDRHNLSYLLKWKKEGDRRPAAGVIAQLADQLAG
jgi:transcriptional regulator with GAF, ATPase, and Fis domain